MGSHHLVEPWEDESADCFGLLEPTEVKLTTWGMNSVVPGWRFLRGPGHPHLLEDVPAGGLLFRTPELWNATKFLNPWLGGGGSYPWVISFEGEHVGVSAKIAEDLFEIDQLLRNPTYRTAMALSPVSGFGSAIVEVDLCEIGLQRGDILLRCQRHWRHQPPPRVKRFSRGDLGYLRDRLMVAPHLITSLTPCGPMADVREGVVNRQFWTRAKDGWRPHIFRWRPSGVPELFTIQAGSDESALFELIHSAGCQMPEIDA